MAATAEGIVGRESELESLENFLGSLADGPTAMLLAGEAGIGKTTLWRAALETAAAKGIRVLSCRPGEVESGLSFAALTDLLEPALDDVLPLLPEPQRRALEVALLRIVDPGPSPYQRAVSLAVLGGLRMLSEHQAVLLAIDDLHWLDLPSARVLQFALRRLEDEPVALVATIRSGDTDAPPLALDRIFPSDRFQRLVIGPLDQEALDRLLRARLDRSFLRPALLELHRTSGGNPYFALELAGSLIDRGEPLAPGVPLPTPDNLRDLIGDRLARLPATVRETLLVVAVLSHPTVDLVDAVLRRDRIASSHLSRAARAGVIELEDGRIRFAHPLLASAVYSDAPPERKRRIHGRLAEVVADPEERARHLALSSEAPDPRVASALGSAARRAQARAAPETAATLAELARRFTPEGHPNLIARRSIEAADYQLQAGDTVRARVLLEQVVSMCRPSLTRARALHRLANVRLREESYPAGEQLLEQALQEAGGDLALRTAIHVDLTLSLQQSGELRRAAVYARAGLELAQNVGKPNLLARALINLAVAEFQLGRGIRTDLLERATELIDELDREPYRQQASFLHPSMVWGVMLKWADDFDGARQRFEALRRQALERHEESSLPPVLFQLGELECWLGNLELAARYAGEGQRAALQSGQAAMEAPCLYVTALVEAHAGRVEEARLAAERALAIAKRIEDHRFLIRCLAVLGFVDLSLGNPEPAHRRLERAAELMTAAGYGEPGVFRILPDEIEALVALGDLERAEAFTTQLGEQGRALERPWALATSARSRALLSMARGQLPEAVQAVEEALAHHERLLQPFEYGRTLLVLGRVQRRRKQKRLAREALERALEVFERLGARLWAEMARAELGRIGGRAPAPRGLTATEERIAELATAGYTNRELAQSLFISVKTVETHLTHIYRKLDVSSRRELARAIGPKRISSEQ